MILCAAILALNHFGGRTQDLSAVDLFREGHFAEAVKLCDKSLQHDPSNFEIAILKSRALVFSNHLAEAKATLTPIAESSAATADQKKSANSLLGEAAYRQDDFAAAAAYCRAAGKD